MADINANTLNFARDAVRGYEELSGETKSKTSLITWICLKFSCGAPEAIDLVRAARGVCRHCEGPLPCWSEWGDKAPGKRNRRKAG